MSNRQSDPLPPAHGVYAAIATPRQRDSIGANCAALLDYIDVIVKAGVDGLVLFGSTGEFVHFDIEERKRVLALTIKRSRIPLLVNVSHSSFAAALDLAQDAAEAGAAGILVMPPYFFRYSDDQLFAYYQQIAKAIGGSTPIYLYNIPFFTNPLSAALMERLLLTGAFAGIKDSSGEWPLFETLQSIRRVQPFQLLIGNDRIYSRGRSLDADGIVSGVAAALPELIVALDRALLAKNEAWIATLDSHLQQFLLELDKFPATIAIKQAAVVRGWKLDHSAIPMDEATNRNIADFRRWFENWLPTVLADSAMRS